MLLWFSRFVGTERLSCYTRGNHDGDSTSLSQYTTRRHIIIISYNVLNKNNIT